MDGLDSITQSIGNAAKSDNLLLKFNFTRHQISEPAHAKLFKTSKSVRKSKRNLKTKEKKSRKL